MISVRVVRSMTEVPAEAWDALCGGDPVFSHGWFRALEESGVAAVSPRHLILEEAGRIVGVLPCFIQHGDPYYTLADRLFGPLGPWCERLGLRVLPALLAYSPLAHRTELLLAPGVDRASAVRACAQAMADICQDERLPVSGWLFVAGGDAVLTRALRAGGYTSRFLCPTATWTARAATFDGYLEHLNRANRHRYKMVRHELNRHARSGVLLREEPLEALEDDEELARMYGRLYARYHARRANPISPGFFQALKRHLGAQAVVHTARLDGRLLSYSIVLKGSRRWHMFVSGDADSPKAHADALHFNLNYYFPMQCALADGRARLDYGTASYAAKIQRGCALEPLSLALRAHRRPGRLWLPVWLWVMERWYRWKYRRLDCRTETVPASAPPTPWWKRLKSLCGERQTFILHAMTPDAVSVPSRAPRVDIRLLQAEELALLRPTADAARWELFERFAQLGYRCYGAWRGSTLIGYLWMAVAQPHVSTYFGWIPLRQDEAFVGYIYVWPESRGWGVSLALLRHAVADLARGGIRVVYGSVVDRNVASLKTAAQLGMWPVCRRRYWRIGPIAWHRTRPVPQDHAVHRLVAHERQRVGLPPLQGSESSATREARSWTPHDPLWKQAAVFVRQHGLLPLARRALRRLLEIVWERNTMIEYRMSLEGVDRMRLPRLPVRPRVRVLGTHELELLRPVTSRAMYRRFGAFRRAGFHCYIAAVDGRIVAYNWYTHRPYRSPQTGVTFDVPAGEVFLVYSHTLRPWRGRGIDMVLKLEAFRQLRDGGTCAARTVIDETNRPSVRLIQRWGARPLRRYPYARLGWWWRVRSESCQDNGRTKPC